MRWADLDSLNHVNNVVYLDYAAESRALLVEDGDLDADLPINKISVDFVRPLLLSTRPVRVTSTFESDQLCQEVGGFGSDATFAYVVTTFGPPTTLERGSSTFEPYALKTRRSDSEAGAQASTTKVFEYFQEARVLLFSALRRDDDGASRFVVGHVDVSYGAPIPWRREPYSIRSWISRIGDASLTIEAEIAYDNLLYAHARSVLVGFDMSTQKSRKLDDREKAVLAGFLAGSGATSSP